MKILVVDDEQLIREVLVDLIQSLGHEAVEAPDLCQAVTQMKSSDFDVVITDNDLTNRDDGLLVVQHASSKCYQPNIIWMSGRAKNQPELGRAALALGACEVLAKPFYTEEVREMIYRIGAHRAVHA